MTKYRPQISARLEWVRCFLHAIIGSYPELSRVTRITATYAKRFTPDRTCAMAHLLPKNKFKITMKLTYRVDNQTHHYSRLELLHTLAHELAHVVQYDRDRNLWADHTPARAAIESEIMHEFAHMLEQHGYESDEAEHNPWAAQYNS